MVPELVTTRLRLRAHRLPDFACCAAMWADAEVTRYIGGRPLSQEEAWARFLRYAGHWVHMEYGFWLIEDRATGAFLGEAGFGTFKRDMQPALKDEPELGWVLAPDAQGKGYATEAVTAALRWGAAHLPGPSTVCIIHPENNASIRVAEKCGFRKVREVTYKGSPTLVHRRPLAGA